jgi:hypothetical protein
MGFACVVVAPIALIVSGRVSFHYLRSVQFNTLEQLLRLLCRQIFC